MDRVRQAPGSQALPRTASVPLILLLLAAGTCAQDGLEQRLARDIEAVVAFGGREWGSDSGSRCADWLAARFAALGLEAGGTDGWFQPLPDKGRNVLGWLPATDDSHEWILIGAHFDALGEGEDGVQVGADDNASGVALMLEVARTLAAAPTRGRAVMFVGFDAEEFGLAGSRYLASNPTRPLDDCVAMVCLDILGRSLLDAMPATLFGFGCEWSPGLREAVDGAAADSGDRVLQLAAEYVGPRSDFVGFALARVPFVFLTSGTHRDYHTVEDIPERLDYPSLALHTELVARLLERLLDGPRPRFQSHSPDARQEARNVAHIATTLLAAAELDDFERRQVEDLLERSEKLLARDRIGTLARARLVVQTQWTLLATGSLKGMRERLGRVFDGF